MKTARNVAIVLLLAAAVFALPAADDGASLLLAIFNVVFLGLLAWFAAIMYRRHRFDIGALGERNRMLLYGSLAAIVLTVTATPTLWDTGPGILVWFALVGAACAALYHVFRAYQQHW